MDNGAQFVLDNFDKSKLICKDNIKLIRKIVSEYNTIKYIKTTGNMIEHFDAFKDKKHKFANDFAFLVDYDVLPNEKISDYLLANYKDEINNIITYKDIKEGQIIAHAEIGIYFGGSTRGAVIRRNKKKKIFILVLDEQNNTFYDNGSILFKYYGNNAKIDESKYLLKYKELESKIYAFRKIKRNNYKFLGEVEITEQTFEKDGNKFVVLNHVKSKPNNSTKYDKLQYLTLNQCCDAKNLPVPTPAERKECKTHYSKRNEKVSSYTKHRANGVCDLCGNEAPFKNSFGQPYLECHHVIYIANDGPDRIYNTVALCPNCHKRIHNLGEQDIKRKLVQKIKQYLLDDNDAFNLNNYNKLFGFN